MPEQIDEKNKVEWMKKAREYYESGDDDESVLKKGIEKYKELEWI